MFFRATPKGLAFFQCFPPNLVTNITFRIPFTNDSAQLSQGKCRTSSNRFGEIKPNQTPYPMDDIGEDISNNVKITYKKRHLNGKQIKIERLVIINQQLLQQLLELGHFE
jgi:hypothetical protein